MIVSSLDTTLADIAGVEGWMTDDQARRLWAAARRVGAGETIVEIGSFRGRSAIVLARAAGDDVEVVAIDPHGGGDRGPREITPDAARGEEDNRVFWANLREAGVAERVRHVRLPSTEAHGDVGGDLAIVYVDGAHRFGPARDDIVSWGRRVAPGGTLLIHDAFNAVGVTLAILAVLVPSGTFRYVGRDGSLAEYRREPVPLSQRAANAGRQLAQLPYFVRNGLIKVALILRLRPMARLLGHHTGDWPY